MATQDQKHTRGDTFTQKMTLTAASQETGNAVKKKVEVYKMAEANKAFARFASK